MELENTNIDKLIQNFLSGNINSEEAQLLESWLGSNIEHAKYFEKYQEIWAASGIEFYSQRMDNVKMHVFEKIANMEAGEKKSNKPNIRFFIKIAASVLLVIGISTTSWIGYKHFNDPNIYYASVPLGMTSKMVLPDQSVVWLNAGSKLKYSKETGARVVWLDGEGYFEVTKDPKKLPFIVKANNLVIKVLGTKFNVKSYSDDKQIKVALVEGSVSLEKPSGKSEEKWILSPNQMVVVDKATDAIKKSDVNALVTASWTERKFHFQNETFQEITKQLERAYNVKIKIESESLKNERFYGDFENDEDIGQIIHIMDVDKKLNFTRDGGQIIIREK